MSDARKDTKINKYALDDELERQPDLYLEYAEQHVEAEDARKTAEKDLKELEADLKIKIFMNPKDYGFTGDKAPAVSLIDSAVLTQPEYKEQSAKILVLRKAENKLTIVKESLDQKRSSLKYLSELWMNNYYGSKVGGNVDNVKREKGSEEQKKHIEEKMTNREGRRRR